MAWPTDSIHGFFAREDVMIMGRGLTSRGPSGGLCGLGEESSRYYASLVMPVPVLACLSAAGNLKFIRIRAYASIQTCAPRIPAAHTSGVRSTSVTFFCPINFFHEINFFRLQKKSAYPPLVIR